jgi:hypothetical protein
MPVKLFLLIALILTGLLLWLLPKSRFASRFRLGDRAFQTIQVIGIFFGFCGLIASFIWQEAILASHLYELLLFPVFLAYMYLLLVYRIHHSEEILDEKQLHDMALAGGNTFAWSILWAFLLHALYREGILAGTVFFPLFVFFSLGLFSLNVLIQYRKN